LGETWFCLLGIGLDGCVLLLVSLMWVTA